jgi:hypothetical protein
MNPEEKCYWMLQQVQDHFRTYHWLDVFFITLMDDQKDVVKIANFLRHEGYHVSLTEGGEGTELTVTIKK